MKVNGSGLHAVQNMVIKVTKREMISQQDQVRIQKEVMSGGTLGESRGDGKKTKKNYLRS